MKKFCLMILMLAAMSLTACGADRGNDPVQDTDNEETFAAVEETGRTEVEENQILQRPILKEIADDIDKEEENITENTNDIEKVNITENDTGVINESGKEEIDLSTYGLDEEDKEFLINLCWTVDDFAGPDEMDETFWRNFLFCTYASTWWREVESVSISRSDYSNGHEAVNKVSYEEVENYTQLVFGVEWPGIKPAHEDMSEEYAACYYEDGFYYIGICDPFDEWFDVTDCTMDENNTIYVTIQRGLDGPDMMWTTTLTLKSADNENGFVLTAKQTERLFH